MNVFDFNGDLIFNSLDILLIGASVIFYRVFYKTVIKNSFKNNKEAS